MEFISVFDMFKIGVGPSSSHTLGPWVAASRFIESIQERLDDLIELEIHLYGSLAKTGKGHGTDIALQLGLMGLNPATFEVESKDTIIGQIKSSKRIRLNDELEFPFDPDIHIIYHKNEIIGHHPNGLRIEYLISGGKRKEKTYFSIGGGFITEGEDTTTFSHQEIKVPYPFETSERLIEMCDKFDMNISEIALANENVLRDEVQTRANLDMIWEVMLNCIFKGCHTGGVLPGGLGVTRRAFKINKRLIIKDHAYDVDFWMHQIRSDNQVFTKIIDWISCFALAVNEENASFGRIVTAPTNGAAGVIPAVMMYMILFTGKNSPDAIHRFLLTSAAIGSIFKRNATISAAMGGCQAEIGVSSSMAAAALTEALSGTPSQCVMAAEIAMEHHLGLTCDPVGGLVQVPCIERNAMGAIKAITAAQLALNSDPKLAMVPLDTVVKTMWETALDMNNKYKETSDGGLAANIPISLSEC